MPSSVGRAFARRPCRPTETTVSMVLILFGSKLRVSAVSARTTGCIFTGSDKIPMVGALTTNSTGRRVLAATRRETSAQVVANATMRRLITFTVFLCEHEQLVDRKRWLIILRFVAAEASGSSSMMASSE